MKKFIYRNYQKVWLWCLGQIHDRALKARSRTVIALFINVSFTGLLVWYAVSYRNWLSYGIMVALAEHYILKLIDHIKQGTSVKKQIIDEMKKLNNTVSSLRRK